MVEGGRDDHEREHRLAGVHTRRSESQSAKLCPCAGRYPDAGDAIVELLRPLDPDSPIARFRGKAESKLHHTAYRVADIGAELARLKANGVRLIDEQPRKGAHGNTVAFLHPSSTGGVLIELCQPPSARR